VQTMCGMRRPARMEEMFGELEAWKGQYMSCVWTWGNLHRELLRSC
jgi:hypothetical protein